MRADGLRRRVLKKVSEVAAEGDEEALSSVLEFSHALLLAVASAAPDEDVELEGLTVRSGTAARILALHQEYVRELVRKGEMKATKYNGEFQIPLSEVIGFQAKAQEITSPASHAHQHPKAAGQVPGSEFMTTWLWQDPNEAPGADLQQT